MKSIINFLSIVFIATIIFSLYNNTGSWLLLLCLVLMWAYLILLDKTLHKTLLKQKITENIINGLIAVEKLNFGNLFYLIKNEKDGEYYNRTIKLYDSLVKEKVIFYETLSNAFIATMTEEDWKDFFVTKAKENFNIFEKDEGNIKLGISIDEVFKVMFLFILYREEQYKKLAEDLSKTSYKKIEEEFLTLISGFELNKQ